MAAALPWVSHADECHICSVKVAAEAVSFSVTCSPAQPGADYDPAEDTQRGRGEPGATHSNGVMLPRGGGSAPFR